MAGYVMNLDSEASLRLYIRNGVYATKLSSPNGIWLRHHEATFADYVTMQPGDNIYFFIQRKIYGIGELVAVQGDEPITDCRFLNFPAANIPHDLDYESVKSQLLWDEGQQSVNQRWVCFFRPSPYFFQKGVDMDDVLVSNRSAFKMLRAFWKVSFLKLDDDENQALKDIILRVNEETLAEPTSGIFESQYEQYHSRIRSMLSAHYALEPSEILLRASQGGLITHEMALEAGLLHQLCRKDPDTVKVFGKWDYLSHQVVASPFKPIDYMDRMDVFGYAYVANYRPTKSRFLVVEIKTGAATAGDIDQVMKYVDWVKEEYCSGDYSMISAFVVAFSFPDDVVAQANRIGRRTYTVGHRPARSGEWANLKLVEYVFCEDSRTLRFSVKPRS